MVSTKDIRDRIEADFGEMASEVVALFDAAIAKADYLDHNRIIRCILFLSEKDIEKLKKNIATASYDPRDVMLWAEYESPGRTTEYKRIRNFNNPFSEAEKNVEE